MKKLSLLISFFLILSVWLLFPKVSTADGPLIELLNPTPETFNENTKFVTIGVKNLIPGRMYYVCHSNSCTNEYVVGSSILLVHQLVFDFSGSHDDHDDFFEEYNVKTFDENDGDLYFRGGKNYEFRIIDSVTMQAYQKNFRPLWFLPEVSLTQEGSGNLTINISDCKIPRNNDGRNNYDFDLGDDEHGYGLSDPSDLGGHLVVRPGPFQIQDNGEWSEYCNAHKTFSLLNDGNYKLKVRDPDNNKTVAELKFSIENHILTGVEVTMDPNGENGKISESGDDDFSGEPGVNPCGEPGGQCDTAIGFISSNGTEFIGKVLEISLGIAGAIALIFMVIGSIRVLTSSGDQQKLNGGREQIIAAVAGLLFLVFSILILQFIDAKLINVGFQ